MGTIDPTWYVGQKIYIRDTVNIDIIEIKTIASNTITADLTNSYLAGCKLQADISYCVNNSYSNNNLAFLSNRTTGEPQASVGGVLSFGNTAALNNVDPEVLNDEYVLGYWLYVATGQYRGTLPNAYCRGSNVTLEEVLSSRAGDDYRCFNQYSTTYPIAVREV